MAVERSGIEWTDSTWSPIRGCSRVSAGCMRCYAERVAARFSGPGKPYEGLATMTPSGPRWTGEVRLVEKALDLPLRWKKPRRIFINSMSDLFHEAVPDEWIDRILGVIVRCPQHVFQVLTKRSGRMREYMSTPGRQNEVARTTPEDDLEWLDNYDGQWAPTNLWLGVSVEDQATADERIPLLLQTPAAVRWVSYEPALGPVEFDWLKVEPDCRLNALTGAFTTMGVGGPITASRRWPRLDWLVIGGESGPGARPFELEWARVAVSQCRAAGVPVFVKQIGSNPAPTRTEAGSVLERLFLRDRKGADPAEWPEDLRVREWPKG